MYKYGMDTSHPDIIGVLSSSSKIHRRLKRGSMTAVKLKTQENTGTDTLLLHITKGGPTQKYAFSILCIVPTVGHGPCGQCNEAKKEKL